MSAMAKPTDIRCQLDVQYPRQIETLLCPPTPQQTKDYFKLLTARHCDGLKVKQNIEIGKGVYASMDFQVDDLVLKDQMLVGVQHISNKVEAFVCSNCFRYIDSIELQIGRRLYLQGLNGDFNPENLVHASKLCEMETYDSEVPSNSVDGSNKISSCVSSGSHNSSSIPEKTIDSLMNGTLALLYSKKFSLPPVVSCIGGCEEEYYCSNSCAEDDWRSCHSLLCPGPKSVGICREALVRFKEHASETNDIFLLAAKVISSTILKYQKIRSDHFEGQGKKMKTTKTDDLTFPFLLEAWKPFSMGYKKRWWDCVAFLDDLECCEESSFRMQMKELAYTSLQHLKAAIFNEECEPLFSLEMYGHIIGMFELNNLDLVVASPVEDYFIYISDLPPNEKEEAERLTSPLLEALGEDYAVCCQGSAFFPIHSCMNHSCCPNSKAFKRDEDRDGQATIIAVRPISDGDEITISYIDEDLPYEERQASLADYGFVCKCPKCLQESP